MLTQNTIQIVILPLLGFSIFLLLMILASGIFYTVEKTLNFLSKRLNNKFHQTLDKIF